MTARVRALRAGHWFDKSVSGFGKAECHGCSTFGPAMLVDGQQWYPWVILPPRSEGRSFSLAAGMSQPFLMTVHADNNTTPGDYRYKATVTSTADMSQAEVDVRVTVHNFTLPAESSRLSLWGVGESSSTAAGIDLNTTQFHDFLLDHRTPVNSLYAGGSNFPSVQREELQRLWARGQRVWEPSNHFGAGRNGALGYPTAKLEEFVQAMNKSVGMALRSGWPMENLLLYAFDEPGLSQMPGLEQLSRVVKQHFPAIKIATCGDEQWAYFGGSGNASIGDGTGNGTTPLPVGDGRLEHVDIIVPRAYQYSLNWSQARPTSLLQIIDRLPVSEPTADDHSLPAANSLGRPANAARRSGGMSLACRSGARG